MKRFVYKLEAENGLHARPAGALASYAREFKSSIKISALGKEADAKRLLSLMSLGATYGTELHFEIDGEDEDIAYEKMKEYCENEIGGMR